VIMGVFGERAINACIILSLFNV